MTFIFGYVCYSMYYGAFPLPFLVDVLAEDTYSVNIMHVHFNLNTVCINLPGLSLSILCQR